jgi:hypothetical protein
MIRVFHPRSRILDPDTDFLSCRIPDPGVKKAPNPGAGSGSATLIYFLVSDMVQKILSVQFYNTLSTYNAKIIIILYTFLKFDKKNELLLQFRQQCIGKG